MLSSITGAATRLVDGLVDGATDMAAGLLAGEQAKPLKEAKDQLGQLAESLAEPQRQLSKLSQAAGSLPTESVTLAKEQIESLFKDMQDAASGDASKLLPPGAGCIAKCWVDCIRKKLHKISDEVTQLQAKVTQTPLKATEELKLIKGSIDAGSGGLGEVASVIQDAAATLKGSMMSMDKLKNLGGTIGEVEDKLAGSIQKANSSIDAISTSIGNTPSTLVNMVEEVISDIDTFKMRTPKKVTAAFKPPPCCCCLRGGKASEGQETIEKGFDSVVDKVNLESLLEGVKGIKGSLEGLDLSAAKMALEEVAAAYPKVLAPAKEAAGKISSAAGAVS